MGRFKKMDANHIDLKIALIFKLVKMIVEGKM